jgi:hypothetical protein
VEDQRIDHGVRNDRVQQIPAIRNVTENLQDALAQLNLIAT